MCCDMLCINAAHIELYKNVGMWDVGKGPTFFKKRHYFLTSAGKFLFTLYLSLILKCSGQNNTSLSGLLSLTLKMNSHSPESIYTKPGCDDHMSHSRSS